MNTETPGAKTDWQSELTKQAFKYHLIVCWAAIILNPLWGIGDYFNIPQHWKTFFVWRCSVALVTFIGFLFRRKLGAEIIAYIPFMGISLQNAYMYSVMNTAELQKHTFAYIALFIGAGMLLLWKPMYTFSVVLISLFANVILFHVYSVLPLEEILTNGGLLTATVAIFSILLIHTRYNLTKKEIIARLALEESRKRLEEQKILIEEKNREITDSINYAKGIQQAILPSVNELKNYFPDSFIYFHPKDIVSGDFFWFVKKENDLLIAAVDCTGHGVPGALMSMLGQSFLNEIVNEKGLVQPDEILFLLREKVIQALRKKSESEESTSPAKDGMDIALCRIRNFHPAGTGTVSLQFAGAFNSAWVIRNGACIETGADKFPVGIFLDETPKKFTLREMPLLPGDSLYLFTDGYADQFGGPKGKKFKYRQFQEILIASQNKIMQEQEKMLGEKMKNWRGNLEQVDDMLVIGLKI